MATSYKSPGVFIEEIPKFPPSIAAVETAIPAFIGYTAKAEKNGESLLGKPVRISSLLEFSTYFGEGNVVKNIGVETDTAAKNFTVKSITIDGGKRFYLYDALRQFYDNGGGDCYVASVGLFQNTDGTVNNIILGETDGSPMGLLTGLYSLEREDEPTIFAFPDAVNLIEAEFYSLQQAALMQCQKLQDRVAVFDLLENKNKSLVEIDKNTSLLEAVNSFRNNIGMNGLKYGMAYAPWVVTSYPKEVNYEYFRNNVEVNDGTNTVDLVLKTMTSDPVINAMVQNMEDALADTQKARDAINAIRDADPDGGIADSGTDPFTAKSPADRLQQFASAVYAADDAGRKDALNKLIAYIQNTAEQLASWWNNHSAFSNRLLRNDVQTYAASEALWRGGVKSLIGLQRNSNIATITGFDDDEVKTSYPGTFKDDSNIFPWLGVKFNDIQANPKVYTANGASVKDQARMMVTDLTEAFNKIIGLADTILSGALSYQKAAQDYLYANHPYIGKWVLAIKRELSKLPPSGSVCGVYARVDNQRGVWKAPANESLNFVTSASVNVTAEEQGAMNVDPLAGKSINILRNFIGKGTLIWGARTLAGNDNEWRYVNVRRFFNMVEESSKNAAAQFVFEPNDANTWVKVQGMIENFLTTLWRAGALQGAKPDHAFYVAVGLGKTMTALDILEGRMIVEIGMAVVRPAEFIILRFSHKMAES